MAGVKSLRKIQLGRETTAGTNAAASTVWRGNGTLEDQMETVFVDEDVGYLGGLDRSYIPSYLGALSMEPTPATYEQILHILEAGVKTVNTGTGDGSGSGKVYTYALPTTSANTPKYYSIEAGDNQQAEEMSYCFITDWALAGAPKEAVMMSASWLGRQVSPTTYTADKSAPSVHDILFGHGTLWIDTTGSTFGTTQKTETLLGFDLQVKSGFQPVFSGDGNLYYTFVKQIAPEITLSVTFEHDTNATAQITNWRAGTAGLVRLKFEGASLTTSGTTYSKYTLIVDLAGKWESFEKIAEVDGNDVRTGVLRSRYNTTASDWGRFIVVNESATVP